MRYAAGSVEAKHSFAYEGMPGASKAKHGFAYEGMPGASKAKHSFAYGVRDWTL